MPCAHRVCVRARVKESDMKEWGLYLWLEDSRRCAQRDGRERGRTPLLVRCVPLFLAALSACALAMLLF